MSPKVATWRRTKEAVIVLSAILAVATVGFFLWTADPDQASTAGSPDREDETATSSASSLPDGPVQVMGVEVLQPVADAGRVALNTAVQREWRLRNTGTTPITLGRAYIEVLEGC